MTHKLTRWLAGAALTMSVLALTNAATASPETAMASGKCVVAHAYVDVNGENYGQESDLCLLPTDCTGGYLGSDGTFSSLHWNVKAPQPADSGEATCYAL